MPRQAARYVFSDGNGRPKYLAWVPVTVLRKMDLSPEMIAKRESNAYCFYSGWDDTLHSNGLLIKIQDADLPEGIAWLVDFVEASKTLGCTISSLCKNIEVMRHMTSVDKKLHYVLARYNFLAHRRVDVICTQAPPAYAPAVTAKEYMAILKVNSKMWARKLQDRFDMMQKTQQAICTEAQQAEYQNRMREALTEQAVTPEDLYPHPPEQELPPVPHLVEETWL